MKLGVIGYGGRIRRVIEEIKKQDPTCRVTAITDIRKDELLAQDNNDELGAVEWYDAAELMMAQAELDGVLIGTRCSLHTEMAVKVLPSGIPLFLEKPVSTSFADLRRLKEASTKHRSEVVVSFPMRVAPIVQLAKEIIDSGKIGTVEHVQAVNNATNGGVYFHNWYRDENETGGMFLQKATHDFDYINHILQMQPVSVCAMTSKQVFKGSKSAGLKCIDCDENRTCPETSSSVKIPAFYKCCFAEDTGNEDSGSALVRYESGMHVSYTQNFVVRREAGYRGARFIGYKGTMEFDFRKNEMKVSMHHTPRVETYQIQPGDSHYGGDAVLAQNFVEVMSGVSSSISPLEAGMLSALLCLKARESARTGAFQSVDWNF
ncbi:MAG: oxidoreductase [Paenibacillus sp.]|jgi:predicted dehydrogenase|nr:oxidoreductase [Paenibacillus sp.]